jgi:CheY-like chemotaxis protein
MLRILVIEDHALELKLASHVLEAAGHEVNGLEAADLAFASILEDKPDLVLLDMSLPGMDSLALVRSLKADIRTEGILIVAVTSYPEKYSKESALSAGCDAYLMKPLSIRTLSQDLHEIVQKSHEPTGT